jgi:acyl-CoA thioester hydrolase
MVHFSMFFRYMEESEHALWRAAGLNIWESGENLTWPRISASFDFKSPLKFQDEFEVHTEMGAVTRSTVRWNHVIRRGEVVIGTGHVTAIFVKKNADGSMKSTELPSELVATLRAALEVKS